MGCCEQVVLSYALSMGQVVLPRSQDPEHMEGSLQALRLRLSTDELLLLSSLDGHLPL